MKRALTALLLLLVGCALAQPPVDGSDIEFWSVQVVALRDLREAEDIANQLKRYGFDAFTEFAMDQGKQFVRVRVGCFVGRQAALAMADALRGHVTDSAVPVEASPGAPVRGCVTMNVGFLKPFRWTEATEPGLVPAYLVEVAGIEAHVAHTGERWRVLQEGEPVPTVLAGSTSARFSQASVAGVALVRLDDRAGGVLLCPGTLLNSVGSVAITEQGEAIVACNLEPNRAP